MPETADYPVWDQFRNTDGSPTYPQRPLVLGPLFAAAAAGTVQSGPFEGKMIVVESLLDREALPLAGRLVSQQGARAPRGHARRQLPTLVHGQRAARRRRSAGKPDPHDQLPGRVAAGSS